MQYLEPFLQTKQKEEVARCLVNIHEKAPEGNIAAFLATLVDRELNSYGKLYTTDSYLSPLLHFMFIRL